MSNQTEIKEKVIIVTGGTKNIGKCIVESYLHENNKVAIIARNENELNKTVTELNSKYLGEKCYGYLCDIMDRPTLEKTFNTIIKDLKQIDILINNAGSNSRKKIESYSSKEWEEEIGTNLTGTFNCSMEAFKYMSLNESGHIINISSIKAKEATSSIGYGASKAGVIGLTKSLAKQFIKYNIYVNCVAPGFINTGMSKLLSIDESKEYLKRIPIGRMGEESEVANVIKFLTSPMASYIVGATIDVNGGYLMD